MQYLNKTFTLATTTKPMTQEEYEIAVGLRKPIAPHCMGTAFPDRPITFIDRMGADQFWATFAEYLKSWDLPTAADLDRVAEEQSVKDATK